MFIFNFVVQFSNKRHFRSKIRDIAPLILTLKKVMVVVWSPPQRCIDITSSVKKPLALNFSGNAEYTVNMHVYL
jgi:hypothetical protein